MCASVAHRRTARVDPRRRASHSGCVGVVWNTGLMVALATTIGLLATALFRIDAKIDRIGGRVDNLGARMDARFDRLEVQLRGAPPHVALDGAAYKPRSSQMRSRSSIPSIMICSAYPVSGLNASRSIDSIRNLQRW